MKLKLENFDMNFVEPKSYINNAEEEMEKEALEFLKDFDTWKERKKKLNNEEEDTDSSIDLGVIDEEV
jgi:hypothetical protein